MDANASLVLLISYFIPFTIVSHSQTPLPQTHSIKMTLTLVSQSKHFGGLLTKYTHVSAVNQCTMTFNVFLPKTAAEHQTKVPVRTYQRYPSNTL